MLLSFSVENWGPFSDALELNMRATRETRHKERIATLSRNLRILPVAGIFGQNGSGKSQFFSALEFLLQMVKKSPEPDAKIPVTPNVIWPSLKNSPTKFSLEFEVDKKIYIYRLDLNSDEILSESFGIIKNEVEKTYFTRLRQQFTFTPNFLELEDFQSIELLAKMVRKNQTLLNALHNTSLQSLAKPISWLVYKIVFITPSMGFERLDFFANNESSEVEIFLSLLEKFQTEITKLSISELDSNTVHIQSEVIESVLGSLTIDESRRIGPNLIVTKTKNGPAYKTIRSVHTAKDGSEVFFDLKTESDGIRRLLELFPAFIALTDTTDGSLFVIDEIDRSIHSLATEALISFFLNNLSPESGNQLIFTSHDTNLLTQTLFRRDELWAFDKSNDGKVELFSFSEIEGLRFDSSLRKLYLTGRLGGTPKIMDI